MAQTRTSIFRSLWPKLLANASMRVRLMSLLGIISALTFLFCATSVVYFVYRTEAAAWRGRQQDAAQAAAQTVSGFIRGEIDALTYLARFNLAVDPMIIQDLLPLYPELLEVVRLDADGLLTASGYQERAVLSNQFTIPLSQWFLRAKAGEQFFGGVQISSNDEPYLIVAVPSIEGGVVAARLDMEVLWEVVAGIRFGETGRAYVVDQTGDIIAHTNRAIVLNDTDIGEQPELSALLPSADHEWSGEYINFEGDSVVGVTASIGVTGWSLVTELSQAEAYSASRTALIVLGGGILLFMTLLMLAARSFLRQSVLRPIERLRVGSERIGRGELDYRINLRRSDEIGLVANAFDSMADSLYQREQELMTQAAALTIEVNERIHAEGELRRSEGRYRAIVEDQTELVCRFNADGTLTFVNDAYCRYFSKTREELIGHTFMPLIPDEDRAIAEASFSSLNQQNLTSICQHRVIIRPSDIRWMEWTDRAIYAADGNLLEFQSVGRDITEQRSAQEQIRSLNADLERRVAERTEQLSFANLELQSEIAERQRVEVGLRSSEQRLQLALRAVQAGAWEWNMNTNQAFWSDENYRVMGLDPKTAESHYDNWLGCVHPEDRPQANESVARAVDQKSDLNIEFRVVWPDGSIHWINDVGRMTFDPAGHPIGMYGIQMDITERKLAIEKISASLREKEILLKEIHHRVKNNLQIISSLLNLQANSIDDPFTLGQFQDSQNRIRSMALIHERLYRSDDLARVDYGTYLRDLTNSLMQTYRKYAQAVTLKVETDPILLDVDTAIPCGLIVNELVSNALKHAFPDGRAGEIGIEMRRCGEGRYRLVVRDDGVGIPAELDYRHSVSLGLQLVNSLTRQIDGTLELSQEGGTTFEILFSGLSVQGQARTQDG